MEDLTDEIDDAGLTGPVPPEEPMTLKDYMKVEPPYTPEVAAKLKDFFKKRGNNPKSYTYTAKGDLVVFSKSGGEESTIHLKTYVNHDALTRDKRANNRLDAIGEAETEYEAAFKRVRDAHETYTRTGEMQALLAAQKGMAEADQILSRIRYGERAIKSIPNPEVREFLFDQPKETRKLFPMTGDPFRKEAVGLIVLEYPYMDFYGRYVDTPDAESSMDADGALDIAPEASEAMVRQLMKSGKYARIFFESDEGPNGFLSPFFPVEFTLDDTRYFTGLQAYEVLRAEEAGNLEMKQALLNTRSTRTMRFITKKLANQPANPKAVWLRILTAIYQQHPILKRKLLDTETDTLVFADIRKGPSGTGLGERDPGILTQSKWLYENAMGAALEVLRYQFREGAAAESALQAAPTNSVISTDQQATQKVAAIINAKKKFQFKKS
jgi:predicted NAD-dependent protein-ADP-ribosyltransferase YbiA (DUF1768 family)